MGNSKEGVQISATMPEPKPDPDEVLNQSLAKISNKFIIMSGKGGVGKTSTSVNLAIALSKKGHKVGILDVDVHGPDIPRMLGFKGLLEMSGNKKLMPKRYSDNLCAVSVESLLPNKDDAVIWRGPMKNTAIRQFIEEVDWGNLDYLIIDSPPGTGDEPLTIAQLVKDAKAVIVTTPQEVALADVRKSINFCKTVGMEIFGLIENMSGFQCPHCNEVVELLGSGGGEKTASDMGVNFLGKIPFDSNMVKCGDAGVPYQDKHTDSTVTKAFEAVAEKMSKLVSA